MKSKKTFVKGKSSVYAEGGNISEDFFFDNIDPPTKEELSKKYGNNPYYKGREDWGEKLGHKFPNGSKAVKDIINSAAKQMGVDPGLLYTSSMEEGMKLALQGKDTGERRAGYKELIKKNPKAAKEYPIDGGYFYGLNTFGDKYGKIIKPSSFPAGYKFQPYQQTNPETGEVFYNSAAFKSHDDAIMAKAGMMRQVEDAMQARYKKNNINLDPEAQKFFSMVGYNMGEDKTIEMIKSYEKKGYLKDNKFLDPNFKPASWQEPYTNVQRRYQNYKILSDEGHFNNNTDDKTMKNKVPKFAYGGVAMNVNTPQEDMFNFNRMAQESQIEANASSMGLQALSQMLMGAGSGMISSGIGGVENIGGGKVGKFMQNNIGGIMKGIGGAQGLLQMFADGGMVGNNDIEVEGEEAFETPQGQFGTFKGPSHDQGGIPLNVKSKGVAKDGELPDGTFIYPKKFKILNKKTGKKETMADRAEKRNNKESKLSKLLENSTADKLLKDSLARTKANNINQDTYDKMLWHQDQMSKLQSQTKKFAGGGLVTDKLGTKPDSTLGNTVNIMDLFNSMTINPVTGLPMVPKNTYTDVDSDYYGLKSEEEQSTPTSKPSMINPAALPTMGDALGMAGNLFQAIAPLKNTLANREGDTPNINPYENYGNEALATLNQNYQFLDMLKDDQMGDAQLSRNATMNRNANSTRGLNTLRAMNLATDAQHNDLNQKISSDYANKYMGVNNQIASTQLDISGKQAIGEQYRDAGDRQDRDAFFSNLGKNYEALGEGVSRTGKSINDIKARGTQANFMNMLTDLVQGNVMNGTITQKDGIEGMANPVDAQFQTWLQSSFKPETLTKLTKEQIELLRGTFLKGVTKQ